MTKPDITQALRRVMDLYEDPYAWPKAELPSRARGLAGTVGAIIYSRNNGADDLDMLTGVAVVAMQEMSTAFLKLAGRSDDVSECILNIYEKYDLKLVERYDLMSVDEFFVGFLHFVIDSKKLVEDLALLILVLGCLIQIEKLRNESVVG